MPVCVERPELVDQVVLQPIVVHSSPLTALVGIILTSNDEPVSGARVEVPSLQLAQTTNSRGRFSLSPVPAQPRPQQLLVRAKGRELVYRIADDQPAAQATVNYLSELLQALWHKGPRPAVPIE